MQLALVRFDSPANAEAALQKRDGDGKLIVEGNSGAASMLEGDEEAALHNKWVIALPMHSSSCC